MAVVNFKCKRCGKEFNCEVGEVSFTGDINDMTRFEGEIRCSGCGIVGEDEVELTEVGQSQLTELYLRDSGI